MNVWIIVLTTMFSPVIEPLGILPSAESETVDPAMFDQEMTTVPFIELEEEAPPMRYRGIEELFAKINAEEG